MPGPAEQIVSGNQPAPVRQFGISSLCMLLAFISFILAWTRWLGTGEYGLTAFYPGFCGFFSAGVLLIACLQSSHWSAWNLVALAWFVSAANLFRSFFKTICVFSCDDPDTASRLMQECVYSAIVSAITLSLFCTIPVVYLWVFRHRSRPEGITRWIYASLVVVLVDALAFVALISFAWGTWRR